MKYAQYLCFVVMWWVLPTFSVSAAEITFSVLPNNASSDEVTIIETSIDGKGVTLNALEGTIGFLGEGAMSITKVVVETGDSVFTLWPTQPLYDERSRVIRFTAGTPESFSKKGSVFRMRIYSTDTKPITVSWLNGAAYQGDGAGTPEGISSRSLVVKPEKGTPNVMRATSDDRRPPQIISADVAYDADTYGESPFISVYATDDFSGISHYEFVEYGVKTSTDIGTYRIQDTHTGDPILVIVYDKAGNSSSVKVFTEAWGGTARFYNFGIVALLLLTLLVFYYRVHIRKDAQK